MSYTKGNWKDIESATGEPNARAIINEDGIYIADCYSLGASSCQAEPEEAQANAERIVQCVNSHDDLLEALKQAKMDFNLMRMSFPTKYDKNYFKSCEEKIQQAINKAEDKQS